MWGRLTLDNWLMIWQGEVSPEVRAGEVHRGLGDLALHDEVKDLLIGPTESIFGFDA